MCKTRRIISMVLAVAMVLTTFGMVAVSAASYSDTEGHWAASYIDTWSNNGVIQGDNGYFRPDDAITRAEVAQVTQNVIGYVKVADNTFYDVPAGAWYEDAVLKLAAAGTLTGNGDGTMAPENYMTREETMTMLARAYGLTVENTQAGITQYADYQNVSDYATGYVGAMTAAGYVGGYEDGTIRPQDYISRAEFVKILDNMIKLYITAPGTYGPGYYGGIAMIKSAGVTLIGVVGNGAVISPQVSGNVTIKDCQFTDNVVNLSESATVESNVAPTNPNDGIVPNTYYGNGPFVGNNNGSNHNNNWGPTDPTVPATRVSVSFYWGDDFSTKKIVSVIRGNKINVNAVPDPSSDGDENWNGLWYKTKEAAISNSGTAYDPTAKAITSSMNLYAGRSEAPDVTATPEAPTAAPGEPTTAPGEPTTAPGEPTTAPGAPTTAPGAPTTAPGEPTTAPAEPTAAPTPVTVTADIADMVLGADGNVDAARFPAGSKENAYNITPDSKASVNGFEYIVTGTNENAIQKSSKEFDDGYASTWSIKTGGAGDDTNRVFTYTPTANGTLKVYAVAGGSSPTTVDVKQSGSAIGSKTYTKGDPLEVFVVENVKAGEPIKIVSSGNTQFYNFEYLEIAAPAEPTTAPAEPTAAPTEPTTAPEEPTTVPTEPTTAPTKDPSITPAPGINGWSFNAIAEGTAYEAGSTIASDNGSMEMTLGVAESDTVKPTIKKRADGDNYLEFNDATSAGSVKQDSWTYTAAAPIEADRVTFALDANVNNKKKDTILLRVFDSNNITADNAYTAGRAFEIKTGDGNGALVLTDQFSGTTDSKNNTSATQITLPNFTYTESEWFSLKVDYDSADNAITVYAGATADTVHLLGSYTLGKNGDTSKTTTVPVLKPTGVGSYTVGGNTVVLGVDNIAISTKDFKAQNVPVTGTAYTTFSDDMRNKPEAYNSAINGTISFTKKGETTPAATAQINADGTYAVELMSDAEYDVAVVSGSEDYTVSPLSTSSLSIPIKNESASRDILFAKKLGAVEYKDTITVGDGKDCKTINEALSLVRAMTRTAGQTVAIVIDPGTYEEELIVDLDDIVLKAADENNKPTVQWYYGIGYVYYSADPTYGWYNTDYAVVKTTQSVVQNWGATLKTTKRGFRAENINVINTFNKRVTEAELADGVTPGGGSRKDYPRTSTSTEVRSKTATERAAAIYADGSEIELYGCSFSSSQDTFGTSADSMYVKNCDIAGNTDYICGGDNCYFEKCNLIWTGYSDDAKGGYITACKTGALPPEDLGYYFKDCTIKNSGESGMKFAAGSWGRSWGGLKCQTIFDNTTLDGVSKPGAWIHMGKDANGNYIEVKDIGLYVVNGVDGTDVSGNTADNPHGPYVGELPRPEDFFGDWTPVHYVPDSSLLTIAKEAAENGSFTVSSSRAAEGDLIKVTPSADTGYEFDTLSVKETVSGNAVALEADGLSFKMPAADVTVTVTFKPMSQEIVDTYAPWKLGQANATDTKGEMEINNDKGKYALDIIERNAYYEFAAPVSSGVVDFDFDIYVDTSIDRNFRVYLENAVSNYTITDNVFAEVINNRGSKVNKGPALDAQTDALFTYDQLGTSGWVHFNIKLDYSKVAANDFITVTATKDGESTPLATAAMGAIAGKDTTLASIRLVKTAAPVYFADMKITQQ